MISVGRMINACLRCSSIEEERLSIGHIALLYLRTWQHDGNLWSLRVVECRESPTANPLRRVGIRRNRRLHPPSRPRGKVRVSPELTELPSDIMAYAVAVVEASDLPRPRSSRQACRAMSRVLYQVAHDPDHSLNLFPTLCFNSLIKIRDTNKIILHIRNIDR